MAKKPENPTPVAMDPVRVPDRPESQPAEDRADENSEQKTSTRQKKYDGGEIPRTHSAKSAKNEEK